MAGTSSLRTLCDAEQRQILRAGLPPRHNRQEHFTKQYLARAVIEWLRAKRLLTAKDGAQGAL
eukprot:6231193-Pyramimonas_sp.AAC.1